MDLGFRSGFWAWVESAGFGCASYRVGLRLKDLSLGLWASDSGLRRVLSFWFRQLPRRHAKTSRKSTESRNQLNPGASKTPPAKP